MLMSYGHTIGATVNGVKLAFDCHASVTTARHANGAKAVAGRILPCLTCLDDGGRVLALVQQHPSKSIKEILELAEALALLDRIGT